MPHTKVKFQRRLGVRLMVFLSLALIPVGLLAVLQTQEVVRRISEQGEALLADKTRAAALPERDRILWALGAANGLGQVVKAVGDDSAQCSDQMATFTQTNLYVEAAGFIRPDGIINCASDGRVFDISDLPVWQTIAEDPREFVSFRARSLFTGRPIIAATAPIYEQGNLLGFAFISQSLGQFLSMDVSDTAALFITFNVEGNVLTISGDQENPNLYLPRDVDLAALASENEVTFTGYDQQGERRTFSVSPIIEDTVYAIGIWSPNAATPGLFSIAGSIPLFPVLMWLTSLVVAYGAVDRLALRHIRGLRLNMRRFAMTREMPSTPTVGMSAEIAEIYDTFEASSRTILYDEAEMEQLVRDKNVLLMEVHHRVKNNLQLISSMMNMQLRQLKSPQARSALGQLQGRIVSLATIHRNLYKTENLSSVEAGPLLDQLVTQLGGLVPQGTRIDVTTQFDEILLPPDATVPVSLLATETVTNALKYAGSSTGEAAQLRVSMTDQGDGWTVFTVENTMGPMPVIDDDSLTGTGLGSSLIRAFSAQLDGAVDIAEDGGWYRLMCRFRLAAAPKIDAAIDD